VGGELLLTCSFVKNTTMVSKQDIVVVVITEKENSHNHPTALL
jgi:hypothetical protein